MKEWPVVIGIAPGLRDVYDIERCLCPHVSSKSKNATTGGTSRAQYQACSSFLVPVKCTDTNIADQAKSMTVSPVPTGVRPQFGFETSGRNLLDSCYPQQFL